MPSSVATKRMKPLSETAAEECASEGRRDSGLYLIGIFKLGKALLFLGIGFGALHFVHHDLGDALERLVALFRFDPENHIVSLVLGKAEQLSHHRLRQISLFTCLYAGLAMTEGIGLLMRKTWAEYLTLWLSVSFIPWECYELSRHPDLWHVSILLMNVAITSYLVWLLRRKHRGTVAAS